MNSWFRRGAALFAASLLHSPAYADFLIVSQNSLHLGWGGKGPSEYIIGKNDFIRALARWPGSSLPQLTFLQEVMPQASEAAVQPPGGTVHFGTRKGNTSYLEGYGIILVNDAAQHLSILCHVDTSNLVGATVAMQRPPDATLVGDASDGTPRLIWLINFHSTFGKGATGMSARRGEVAELGNIIARLRTSVPVGCPQTTDNILVAGDWNLSGSDSTFRTLALGAGFVSLGLMPNDLTSLNTQGGRASPYDHFVYDDMRMTLTLADLPSQNICNTSASFVHGILIPSDLLSFRQHCSDHLGVAAIVRIR